MTTSRSECRIGVRRLSKTSGGHHFATVAEEHDTIAFIFDDNTRIDISFNDDTSITVRSGGNMADILAIEPVVSNTVNIRCLRR